MKLLLLALACVAVAAVCPLNRPLKIQMYQFIPDLAGDFLAGLKAKLEAQFLADTGCTANLDFSWDVNTYDARTVKKALKPCSASNPLPLCGYDMVEIDTAVLDDLTSTPNLLQPMPLSVKVNQLEFFPQSLFMVRDDGDMWAQPSYSCDNLFFSYESGLEDITSRDQLLSWINAKRAGNTTRYGYSADFWAVWDLTTMYVDAHLDTFPFRPLCCAAGTAYNPNINVPIANGLKALSDTCYDTTTGTNPCLTGVFYNNPTLWFDEFLNGRTVVLQGFSSYISNFLAQGGSLTNLHVTTAVLGSGSQSYLFTDAFVLSKSNCVGNCVNAAALWLNWQRLEGQIIINLGKDLTPNRPRYLVSSNRLFYTDSRLTPYKNVYDYFYNSDGTGTLNSARPLNTEHYTDKYCDQYANLAAIIPTGSTCALQNKANQP